MRDGDKETERAPRLGPGRPARASLAMCAHASAVVALLVLFTPLAARAALPGDLERSLTYVPARFAAPDAPPGAAAESGARVLAEAPAEAGSFMAPGAFCPPRRSSPSTTLTHLAGFAAAAWLAIRTSRPRSRPV